MRRDFSTHFIILYIHQYKYPYYLSYSLLKTYIRPENLTIPLYLLVWSLLAPCELF